MTPTPYKRTCTECGEVFPTSRPDSKTCGSSCRAKRSRRLRNLSRQRTEPASDAHRNLPHQAAIASAVRDAPDIAHEMLQQELAPIIREALTDEVLQSIHKLVGLTPAAVAQLGEDLHNENANIRQKAYSLLLRYTVGHPALIHPVEDESSKQLIVNFAMPRPAAEPAFQGMMGQPTEAEIPDVELVADDEDTRECDVCDGSFPVSQFIANSNRCSSCFQRLQDNVKDMLAPGKAGAD